AYRRGYIVESKINSVKARFLDLRGSWVKGSHWRDSDLQFWVASGARIEKTQFINCDLQNANFWGTNLQESDFSGSDLRGANLENSYVLFTKFDGVKFNSKTLLPFSKEEALKRGMVEGD
ncbi:MAG: pentapeptide repeat-containing protein, partial [Bdellovibrionales bacterium]|nr:pentapeptide repeat-containing protein [Bdellovibrionales bacterium]NQZ18898.1 pentapeptide repeat-containing protein [Bdellovibrionales bacterium]